MGDIIELVNKLTRRSALSTRHRPRPTTGRPDRRSDPARPHDGSATTADVSDGSLDIEYSPCLDGDPDPGEVVWTWVPYEDDPSKGKDRPVVIIGRLDENLLGVPLTSKRHDDELQVVVGRGPWDREDRLSYAKVERLLEVDPSAVRREGAVLHRQNFDDVVAGVRRAHRGQ